MLIINSINLNDENPPAEYQTIPKGLYFNFLAAEKPIRQDENQYIASKKIGIQTFLEIKGSFEKDWNFDLSNSRTTFWLAFQFLGSSSLKNIDHSTLNQQQYLGYFNTEKRITCQLKGGKAWMVFIGIEIEDPTILAQEWNSLQIDPSISTQIFPAQKIGYRIKKVLEMIEKIKYSVYSINARLQFYTTSLLEIYHGDLLEQQKSKQQDDISLLHRAKAYILEHYMDENLKVDTLVKALLTSKSTLSRVFQENNLTIKTAIRTIRIYKGREMLRTTNLSVDMVAFHVQFSTAKYFIKTFVNYFGHTPATERKLHPPPSKIENKEDDN